MKRILKKDKSINNSKLFSKKFKKNPISFLKNLIIDVKANRWNKNDLLKAIKEFLKKDIRK